MRRREEGLLIVLSAVSGAGKTTVVNELIKRDKSFVRSISCTTRERHEKEVDGVDYFFVNEERFRWMVEKNMFLEYQNVHSHLYGTPKRFVLDMLKKGKNVVLVIDTKGGLNVKRLFPEAILVFMLPPSLSELMRRLNLRGRESLKERKKRIKNGKEELKDAFKYDYIIVNDVVDRVVEDIRAIARSNRLVTKRNREKLLTIMKEYSV